MQGGDLLGDLRPCGKVVLFPRNGGGGGRGVGPSPGRDDAREAGWVGAGEAQAFAEDGVEVGEGVGAAG